MNRYEWSSPVSTVVGGDILIRGYAIDELIDEVTFSDSIYLVLKGGLPAKAQSDVFRASLSAILDYAMGPAPFSARVVASANPELGPAMAAGILAQGKYAVSPQDAGEFIESAYELLLKHGKDYKRTVEQIVTEYRTEKKRIPGIGHPSSLGMDPRAKKLGEVLERNNLWKEKASLFTAIQEKWNEVTGKHLVVNVDGMLGIALSELSFKPIEMGGIAALSMLPGIIANAVHEMNHGQPIRQIPDLEYTGVPKRSVNGVIAK
jgi:citrate synthase